MREYSPKFGQEIQAWFDELSKEQQAERLIAFHTQLHTTKVTPTYKPCVLVNLVSSGASISEALTLFSHIELSAMSAYNEGLKLGTIPINTPLNFRIIAFKESIELILSLYRSDKIVPEITMNEKAEISAQKSVAMELLSRAGP